MEFAAGKQENKIIYVHKLYFILQCYMTAVIMQHWIGYGRIIMNNQEGYENGCIFLVTTLAYTSTQSIQAEIQTRDLLHTMYIMRFGDIL
jgi:hypothetical protein